MAQNSDSQRCGNCKYWTPMYTAFTGWCRAPIPRCIWNPQPDAMHDYEGDDCPTYTPKEPANG